MPQNNNNQNNKKKGAKYKGILESYFGDEINQELRHLIDLAVRKQFDTQQFVERFSNTHYFRQKFPGLIEHGGTIANGLTGQQGATVSASSLASAIAHYKTALDQTQLTAQQYGYHNFGKDQFAKLLRDETSPDEFKSRLQAVETVNSNPLLKDAFEAQQRAQGIKVNGQSAYKEALNVGSNKFMNTYEGALYQQQLGLSRNDAAALAKGGGSAPVGTTFEDLSKVVAFARENLQSIGPELANQGLATSKLVKALNNPNAFPDEIAKIKAIAEQRTSQFGTPVAGTYAQQGQSGGFSQFNQQREQGYG
jgi:hypothetical protein